MQVVLLILIVCVVSFPLFIIIYNHIPPVYLPFTEGVRIDHVLTFAVVFTTVYILARRIRYFLYLFFAGGLLALSITSFTGHYTFRQLYSDYSAFLHGINHSAIRFRFDNRNPEDAVFGLASQFREAIDYRSESVRNYAADIAVMHFEEYVNNSNRKIIQFFSVFKEIRKRWRYVFDPVSDEYFAKASETVRQLKSDGRFKGDCDDYSILMAACIKAIGGEVKLVRTTVQTEQGSIGHVYPEVLAGTVKDLENISYLIRQVLFVKENQDQPIYYHVDENGRVWLNFDYNDYYPGGKYQSTIRRSELRI